MRSLAICVLIVAACKPDLGSPESLIDSARYLTIVSDPPDVNPGDPVTLHAIVVSPDGTVADGSHADWAICTTPKPVSVNNVVSDDCVFDAQTALPDHTLTVPAIVPPDACQLFGPDPPPQPAGQPPLRPTDPDPTGGYFQPVRSLLQVDPNQPNHYIAGFGLPRVICNLPDAPIDVAEAFRQTYVPNTNPTIARVTVSLDGVNGVDVPADVPSGREVTFDVLWPASSAETYPVFDRASRTLVQHREALRVSWFATDGVFEHDHTGAGEDAPATDTQNLWTAPPTPGVVHMWVVLRDSRGGADVRAFDLDVKP